MTGTNGTNNGKQSETCEGCCEAIYDRFVMRVSNLSWHEDCLSCTDCHTQLTSSCYYKEGKLLCRTDYEKRFGVKCGRCNQYLAPEDLVMRTLNNVFHLHCFVCSVCCRPLTRGDQYVIRSGQVVCRSDYEKEYFMVQGFTSHELVQEGQQGSTEKIQSMADEFVVEASGRQRDGRRGPKRPRTILTAAQRRQFKASFEISPKPCRKVREALGRETGLSVRVVQVWFQNQRAKMKKLQRRGKVDKDGKKKDDESGGGGGGKRGTSSTGSVSSGNGGEGSTNGKKEDNYEESVTSNDGLSDDDGSLVFDNLDEADTPEPGEQCPGQEKVSQSIHPSDNPATSHPPPPPHDSNPNFGMGYSGPPPPPPSHLGHPPPAHLPQPMDNALGLHHPLPPHPPDMLQNPIDKLYLMQDSYFTQM